MNPNKELWEKGDFGKIAACMRGSSDELADSLGVGSGMQVLDLACGDGAIALPMARRGADVVGVDIASNLVAAAQARVAAEGLRNCCIVEGDASDLKDLRDDSFDLVVTMFGAMFAPRPYDVAREMVRVTRPGGRIVMGNWIPGDPTLVGQMLKISSEYGPPPPDGFVSPMTWGLRENVVDRFGKAGIPEDAITTEPAMYRFEFDGPPSALLDVFRDSYGPVMRVFEHVGPGPRADEAYGKFRELFEREAEVANGRTEITARLLRVTVNVPQPKRMH